MSDSSHNVDAEQTVAEYRTAYEAGAKGVCEFLRRAWAAWQGKDNLHETAFAKP